MRPLGTWNSVTYTRCVSCGVYVTTGNPPPRPQYHEPVAEYDDPFADPRTPEEKRASVEGWEEFGPCAGFPHGGWEKWHVHPFDETRTVLVRKPRLF